MYKSKLQELCHKNRWALPTYSGMRDGPEHNPRFKASVVVSGTNFDTINICKSLKEAYSEAAKLAFLHFSSDGESTRGGASVEQAVKIVGIDSQVLDMQDDLQSTRGGTKVEQAAKDASINTNSSSTKDDALNFSKEIDAEEQKRGRTQKRPEIHPDSLDTEHDLQQKFKTKLQIYAQRKGLGLPLYCSTREGPPNSLCFRATVTVGCDSFESPGNHKTIRQAKDAAAQVALMALSTDAFQENDIGLYKNLLQEFARSEGFFMPQYKTTRTREAHDPIFYATVEVEGETFEGNPAKSKKQAELNAAKVAYTAFMHRKSCWMGDALSTSLKNDVLKLAPLLNSCNFVDMIGNHKYESQRLSTSSVRYEAPNEVSKGKLLQTDDFSSSSLEDEVLKLTPHISLHSIVKVKGNQQLLCPTVSTSTAKYEAWKEASSDEDEETAFDKSIPAKAKFKTKENSLVSSYKDSSTMKMATEIKSYLLNNRIRVYTSIPDVVSPKGNVVLPIAEGKWAVVSLEFPN